MTTWYEINTFGGNQEDEDVIKTEIQRSHSVQMFNGEQLAETGAEWSDMEDVLLQLSLRWPDILFQVAYHFPFDDDTVTLVWFGHGLKQESFPTVFHETLDPKLLSVADAKLLPPEYLINGKISVTTPEGRYEITAQVADAGTINLAIQCGDTEPNLIQTKLAL